MQIHGPGGAASITFLLAALPALASAPGWPAPGFDCDWHGGAVGYALPRWMSRLGDATGLDTISMVGTHDTGTTRGGDAVATQTLSIPAQLNMGVRVLDLRFKHLKNSLEVYHGIISQNLTGRNFVGILMTDFPGPLLMDTVTRLNAFAK